MQRYNETTTATTCISTNAYFLRMLTYYPRNKKYDKAMTYTKWANEVSDKARLQMKWANEAREKARLRMKWAQEAMEKARK